MSDRPNLLLEVTCEGDPGIQKVPAIGWEGSTVQVEGKIGKIVICKDGTSQLGIRIHGDGTITLTDYGGLQLQYLLPQNVTFYPNRPWRVNDD